VAPIRQTYPHPIWDQGELIGRFLDKLGLDPALSVFFDLMPDVDLEQIKEVGNEIWGTDLENVGVVTGALNHAATQIPRIRDMVGESWSGEAFDRFKEKLDIEEEFFGKAQQLSQNVGQALVEFAEAANASLADGMAVLIGIAGGVVGAIVGFIMGIPTGPGAAVTGAAGAIAGALVGLAIGLLFTFIGTLLPKIVPAIQALNDIAHALPPDYQS